MAADADTSYSLPVECHIPVDPLYLHRSAHDSVVKLLVEDLIRI